MGCENHAVTHPGKSYTIYDAIRSYGSGGSGGGGGGGRGVQMHPPFEGLPSHVLSKPAQK